MHNSESKLSGHFSRLCTAKPNSNDKLFTILLFAEEGNRELAAVDSLCLQSLGNWELVVVSPPSGATDLFEQVHIQSGTDRTSARKFHEISNFLITTSSEYISFLEQGTLWHSERLGHDVYILENSSAAAVYSPPLIRSIQGANAHVPQFPFPINRVVSGLELLRELCSASGLYFGLDVISVRRHAFVNALSERYATPNLTMLRLLRSENIFCSDKCLSERMVPPLFRSEELAAVAQELLSEQTLIPSSPTEGKEAKLKTSKARREQVSPSTSCGDNQTKPVEAAHERLGASLIVPFLNPGRHFTPFLKSLISQEFGGGRLEVILVDNGSTDGSRAVAEQFMRRLSGKLVDARRIKNASYARNVGVEASSANKLLFADADDELGPGYIAALADALDKHDFVCSAADSKALNEKWVRKAHGEPWTGFVPSAFGFLGATGVNIGVRRELFEKIGGFPEHMNGSQDVEFSWRAQLAGASVVRVASAVYRYRLRSSTSSLFRQASNWGRSNALLYRTFRSHGMPGRPLRVAAKDWWHALRRMATARSKAELARATSDLGHCVGRLTGSLLYRVVYL